MKMKLYKMRKLLWGLLFVLVCVSFHSENIWAREKNTDDFINDDQEPYIIDKENMTISHGEQIYHYEIEDNDDAPDIYIYFSDGAVYHYYGNSRYGKWSYEDESLQETTEVHAGDISSPGFDSDAIEEKHKDEDVDYMIYLIKAKYIERKDLAHANKGALVLGILFIPLGIVYYFFAYPLAKMESYWKYDGAEPSEDYLAMSKAGSFLVVAIGIGFIIVAFYI